MSLKREFAAKKGSRGFGAENSFSPSNAVRTDITSALLTQRSTSVQHITSFKVYFSYRVGKLTADPRPHKSVKNDDLKTDENGGGSQGSGGAPAATRPAHPRQLRRRAGISSWPSAVLADRLYRGARRYCYSESTGWAWSTQGRSSKQITSNGGSWGRT